VYDTVLWLESFLSFICRIIYITGQRRSSETTHTVPGNKLLYASPAWWGFASADDRNRLEGFLRRSRKLGYRAASTTFASICADGDDQLFVKVTGNSQHLLHDLLPPLREQYYSLRERSHNYHLPDHASTFMDKNFFIRMLYKDLGYIQSCWTWFTLNFLSTNSISRVCVLCSYVKRFFYALICLQFYICFSTIVYIYCFVAVCQPFIKLMIDWLIDWLLEYDKAHLKQCRISIFPGNPRTPACG